MTAGNKWRGGKAPLPKDKVPAGWKWCSLCGDVKKLDEFGVAPRKVVVGEAGFFSGQATTRSVGAPLSRCKACRASVKKRQA